MTDKAPVTRAHREEAVRAFGWANVLGTENSVAKWVEAGGASNVFDDVLPIVAQAISDAEARGAALGEVGQIVAGEARDGMVYYTVEFRESDRVPGVGALVRVTRAPASPGPVEKVACSECGGNGTGPDCCGGPGDVYQGKCPRCDGSGLEPGEGTGA